MEFDSKRHGVIVSFLMEEPGLNRNDSGFRISILIAAVSLLTRYCVCILLIR